MKRSILTYILTAVVGTAMVFAFTGCGGSGGNGGEEGTFHTKASTAVESSYETVVYYYEDYELPEDLYSSTVTIEYDGDKVVGVTEVMVDDLTNEDDDLIQMHLEDYDGALDDLGFKDKEGFTSEVAVDGKVRTETKRFDLTKFDVNTYKEYVGIKSEGDYVTLDELASAYEASGYSKADQTE